MVNITWLPSSIFNGLIVQHIVQRIDSSGKSYYSVSGDQHYLELPYFNNSLVSVAAVNQYGQSSFEMAKSSGKKDLNIAFILCMCTFTSRSKEKYCHKCGVA